MKPPAQETGPAACYTTSSRPAGGNLVVFGVVGLQRAQGAFKASRLGPAGLSEPDRVEWLRVVGGYHIA